ncbi:hypothetical protein GCM10007158_05890 [Vreelandella hamiltonii]|uniref:Uncharacterized protein n=2 Tax=Halomonadaceae TaxID=28256 RepID=A0ABQ2WDN6_9GAMM|nr:hypothetical protein GCM10007158_05890 [Halomonas johnsoniae]
MVEKTGIEEVYNKYSEFVDTAKNKVFFGVPEDYEGPSNNFEISEIVSDSIILVSYGVDNVASVNNFIGSINFFLELGLRNGFMFRGCVNQGDIIFDEERRIFLSNEFNELAKYEPQINAPVCVIFEKAKATVLSSLFGDEVFSRGVVPSKSLPVIKFNVPLKGEKEQLSWCVNYTYFCNQIHLNDAIEYLEGDPVKKSSFIQYIEFLNALPEERLMPNEVKNDGAFVKVMKSRSGMRVAITNGVGDILQTPIQWGFPQVFIKPPEEIEMRIDPKTGQVSFYAKGRWY